MKRAVLVAPSVEPVSLAQAKAHMRIGFSEDDAEILNFIKTAREELEHELARPVAQQTVRFYLPAPFGASVDIPLARSVGAVRQRIEAGVATVVTPWSFDPVSKVLSLPAHAVSAGRDLEIDADVGYEDVPSSLETWILMRTATLYEQRETDVVAVGSQPLEFARHLYDREINWADK